MNVVILGIDLGKNVCRVVGLGAAGEVLVRRRMKRESVVAFTQRWSSSVVAMEACRGAHHLGRQLAAQGHAVRLISREYVRPYVEAQKNDNRDAEAIAEAATRPTMRFVEIKSEAQLDMQTAVLLERGIAVAQGRRRLENQLPGILTNEALGLSARIRELVGDLRDEWQKLNERIAAMPGPCVPPLRAGIRNVHRGFVCTQVCGGLSGRAASETTL
jgi:transposase